MIIFKSAILQYFLIFPAIYLVEWLGVYSGEAVTLGKFLSVDMKTSI